MVASESFPGRTRVLARVGLGVLLWAVVAFWLVPQLLAAAHRGSLPLADLLLRGRGTTPLAEYLAQWHWTALWASALALTIAILAVERRWIGMPALSLVAVLGLTFLFHVAGIRDGMSYGSDAALYLAHARNIVEGVPYADTGYLPNPTHFHSPPTYPPLFPLMLAPVYALGGFALHAMKVLEVAMATLATGAVYLVARRLLPVGPALVAAALFGLSPVVFELKDELASDLPFLAIALLCLWVAEQAQDAGARGDAGWRRGVVVGLLCYAAVATRSVGIVLLPALLLADLLRVRRVSRYGLALAVVALGLIGLQEGLLGNVRAYASRDTGGGGGAMADAAVSYGRFLTAMMFGGLPGPLHWILGAVAIVAAGYGAGVVFLRRWSPTALFLAGYTAALILWPNRSGPRILLPHLALGPVFFLVAFGPAHVRHRWTRAVTAAWLAMFVVSYAQRYRGSSLAPMPNFFTRPDHAEMAAFVSRETSPNDVFISIAPRTFALLTRRTSSIYDIRLSREAQWAYLGSIGATYLVLYKRSGERDRTYLRDMVGAYPDRLRLAFSNEGYELYRIEAAAR